MIRLRTLGLCLVAVFAMSAVATSAAFADAGQEFVEKNKKEVILKKVTSKSSGSNVLSVAGIKVTCATNESKSEIKGKAEVTKLEVTFKGCEVTSGANKCKINSIKGGVDAAAGEIKTVTLKGELGEVAAAEATSEVGQILEPEAGTEFVTLDDTAAPCSTPETKVTGKVAGEVTPVGSLAETGKLEFLLSGGKQKIKTFERSGSDAVEKPSLKAFGLEATQESTKNEVKFAEKVEVVKAV